MELKEELEQWFSAYLGSRNLYLVTKHFAGTPNNNLLVNRWKVFKEGSSEPGVDFINISLCERDEKLFLVHRVWRTAHKFGKQRMDLVNFAWILA